MKFSGIVKKGSDRGKSLGFPTANVEPPKDLEDGLYVGLAKITSSLSRLTGGISPPEGENNLEMTLPALIFVGANVTFNETDRRAEIYLLDFNENIYGHEVEIETIKKLRDPIKFNSAEELIEQMKEDEKVAREFFKTYNKSN